MIVNTETSVGTDGGVWQWKLNGWMYKSWEDETDTHVNSGRVNKGWEYKIHLSFKVKIKYQRYYLEENILQILKDLIEWFTFIFNSWELLLLCVWEKTRTMCLKSESQEEGKFMM